MPVHGHSPLVYPFLLSASEFLSNLLFSYHLLYFCTALFLIIILSSNHLHKSKTLSQLTQCPFTGTLLLFDPGTSTSGPSSGVTVGGTGSSCVQTTSEAAQRVHLPEVAVTIETLIYPVQIFGLVPVLFRLPVGSQASQ